MMIADQVEATARSMGPVSDEDYRAMIARTIDRLRSAGQMDWCPLTFSDLTKIQVAMTSAVAGIHHRRIKYPGQEHEESPPSRDAASPAETVT